MIATMEEERTEHLADSIIPSQVLVTSPSMSTLSPIVYDELFKRSSSDLIKEATFKKFPMEDRRKTWAACRKSIDSVICKLRY